MVCLSWDGCTLFSSSASDLYPHLASLNNLTVYVPGCCVHTLTDTLILINIWLVGICIGAAAHFSSNIAFVCPCCKDIGRHFLLVFTF